MALEPEIESLSWRIALGETMPDRRRLVTFIAILVGSAGLLLLRSPIMGIVGPLILIGGLAELYFPTTYCLDREGARAKCGLSVTTIAWANVLRVIEDEDGVRLSPFEKPSRTSAFRGVYLRYSGNRDAVLAKIRSLREDNGLDVARKADG